MPIGREGVGESFGAKVSSESRAWRPARFVHERVRVHLEQPPVRDKLCEPPGCAGSPGCARVCERDPEALHPQLVEQEGKPRDIE